MCAYIFRTYAMILPQKWSGTTENAVVSSEERRSELTPDCLPGVCECVSPHLSDRDRLAGRSEAVVEGPGSLLPSPRAPMRAPTLPLPPAGRLEHGAASRQSTEKAAPTSLALSGRLDLNLNAWEQQPATSQRQGREWHQASQL